MGICCSTPGSGLKRSRFHPSLRDTTSMETCPSAAPSARDNAPRKPSDKAPFTATNLSASASHAVFISHAGEDKATIAIPLRKKLRVHGITSFVDEADMPCGTHAIQAMTHAMNTAKIGVFILSPEFVAREWPMKEAMCFLQRREDCSHEGQSSREAPIIIPCFYRLSVADLYNEPRLHSKDPYDKRLYKKSRFLGRQRKGQPEANIEMIKSTLSKLHCIMGVRNDVDANNDSSFVMTKRRDLLLNELCSKIREHVPEGMRTHSRSDTAQRENHNSLQIDAFQPSFPPKLIGKKAVLDFGGRDAQGHPITPEGQVKRYLLEEGIQPSGIVSVCGLGGVGKSTIVDVLMSDDDIRQRFRDGVHLIRLGSDTTSNAFLGCICNILDKSGAKGVAKRLREMNDMEQVLSYFMKWFEGRKCLFFIDDVWERNVNLRALSYLCDIVSVDGGNRILITTREHEIASLTRDARIVFLDPKESRGEVARKILLFHSAVVEHDVSMADAMDPISEILDICAGLPVSLAVAGKNVRKLNRLDKRNPSSVWSRYLSQLQASRQTLLRQTVGRYGDLYATFAASLKFLDEKSSEETLGFATKFSFAEMHRRLCVLPKQTAVPNTMLMHLWSTENKERADSIARVFVEVGLAGYETASREYERVSGLTLHDSVHDFAVWEAGSHSQIMDAHNLLLEGYGVGCENPSPGSEDSRVCWWSRELRDDGYIHEHLSRHLVGAGRVNELRWLLLTPLWAERQTEVNGITHLEDDYAIAMKEIREGEETEEALRLIASAVSLSSGFVLTNTDELWFQLHGRLKGCVRGNRVIEKYVKWIETDSGKKGVLSLNRILVGAGGRNRKIISAEKLGVDCMAIYADGERVACGCGDGSVVFVNIRRSEIERRWKAYEGQNKGVSSIAIAQNGTRVVTVSGKKSTLDVWDVKTGSHVGVGGSHPDNVNCFALTHDGTSIVAVLTEGSLQLWDLTTGELEVPDINVGSDAKNITLLTDGERAIIERDDGKLNFWNIKIGAEIGEFGDGTDRVSCAAMTPDDRRVVSASYDGKVTLWELDSLQEIWSQHVWRSKTFIPGENFAVIETIAVSKDGKRIASGDVSGAIRIWDLESGNEVCVPLNGHTHNVTGVSFLGNNDSIVSSSWDGTVKTWDSLQREDQKSFHGHEDPITGVSITPDNRFVVTGSWDHTLRIWDATSGEPVGDPLRGHSDAVNDVAVTSNGQFIVSVSSDKTVRVWDLNSCNLLHTFPGHFGPVTCVAVAAKDERIVTGSADGTVRLWDMAEMDGSFTAFEGHTSSVEKVFVSDDGSRVISADQDSILLWETETHVVITKTEAHFARRMSRREMFDLVFECSVHDDAGLSIPLWSDKIIHGNGSNACVLATLGHKIVCWDISPEKKTICLGLYDGRVALLRVDI